MTGIMHKASSVSTGRAGQYDRATAWPGSFCWSAWTDARRLACLVRRGVAVAVVVATCFGVWPEGGDASRIAVNAGKASATAAGAGRDIAPGSSRAAGGGADYGAPPAPSTSPFAVFSALALTPRRGDREVQGRIRHGVRK
jgi:hypothetical protein